MLKILTIFILFISFAFSNEINLTKEEQEYLKNKKVLKTHIEPYWIPYSYHLNNKPNGYIYEFQKLIASKLGLELQYQKANWMQATKLLEDGNIDIIVEGDVFSIDKNKAIFSNLSSMLYENVIVGKETITDLKQLENKRVGIISGTKELFVDILPKTTFIPYEDDKKLFLALSSNEIDFALDEAQVSRYYLHQLLNNKFKISNISKLNSSLATEFFIASKKENQILMNIINKVITLNDILALQKKWIVKDNSDKNLLLTKEEKELIKNNTFNLCLQKNLKYSNYLENGKLKGTFGEIYNEISKLTGLKFNYVMPNSYDDLNQKVALNQCDAVTVIGTEQKRFKNIISSKVVQAEQMVAVGKTEHIDTIDFGEDIFYSKVPPYIHEMKKYYPNEKYVHISEYDKIVNLLDTKIHDVLISTINNAHEFIQKYGYDRFKIIQKFPDIYHNLSTGINDNNPLLLSIINKSIKHMGKEKIDEIFKKYELKSYTINKTSYEWLWYVVGILVIGLLILQYRNNLVLREKSKKEVEHNQDLKFTMNLAELSSWKFNVPTMSFEFSPENQKFYGLIDTPIISAQDFIPNVHKDDQEYVQLSIQRAIENDEHNPISYRYVMPDGSVKYVFAHWQAIYASDGKFVLAKGYNKDITKEVLNQKEKEEQNNNLIKQSRLAQMGEMLSMIGHQWRQPLNSLALNNQILVNLLEINNINNPIIKKVENDIQNTLDHLSQTIKDFSNFFKPNKSIEKFNLKTCVEKTVNLISDKVKHSNTILDISIDKNINNTGYENELSQVFMVLINNAIEQLEETNDLNNRNLNIYASQDDKNITIEFIDNGGGVPKDIIDKIFEPYFSTKSLNGTGIGLYMVKMIIEKSMQGTVDVHNKNDGACFTLIIPNVVKQRGGKQMKKQNKDNTI